jgi:hypothetical protein
MVFGDNPAFKELIASAWREFRRSSFRRSRDSVGLAIAETGLSRMARLNMNDLIGWAATSADARAYYQKVSRFAGKRKLLSIIERGIPCATRRRPRRVDVFGFMRHLCLLTYDFDSPNSRDGTACLNELRSIVADPGSGQAETLLDVMYKMATEYATTGGEITHQVIVARIRSGVGFAVPSLNLGSPGILELLRRQVTNKLAAEKNSRKYIPNVFVETTSVKDEARLFCHPALFLQRLEEEIRRFHLRGLNRTLSMAGLPFVRLKLSAKRVTTGRFQALTRDCAVLRQALDELETDLTRLRFHQIKALRPLVPGDKLEVFDQNWYSVGNHADYLVTCKVRELRDRLDIAEGRVFAIVSRAGQGKTNFICDLAERFLLQWGIPCAVLTGRDFRGVAAGQFSGHVARSLTAESTANIDQVLGEIEQRAVRTGFPGVLIFDAINEHDSISTFAGELERFIEKCMAYPHLRIILACRSEYYDERFGNLARSSFSGRMTVKKEIHRQMDDRHKDRLIPAYFRFFKIQCPFISARAKERLSDDVLLLRMFCEAYGNPGAREPKTIPAVQSLRKDALFRTYLDRKLGTAVGRSKSAGIVGRRHPYVRLLKKTLEWMLTNARYANVPAGAYDPAELEVLTQLIDEDLFLRKDPVGSGGILGSHDEVVSFTFEEFRDFLLADYLLGDILARDRRAFDTEAARLTDPESTVCEGVTHYLFLLARQPSFHQTLDIIRGLPWYDRAFGLHVFDLDDQDIRQEDVDTIRQMCLRGDNHTPGMLISLLLRWDTGVHSRANILTMFEIMDGMAAEQFRSAVTIAFRDERYSFGNSYYPVTKLAEHLRPYLLSTGSLWCEEYANLGRLLLYLWNIPDSEYGFPARSLFEEFARAHPELARAMTVAHLSNQRNGYSGSGFLWTTHCSKDN